MPESISSYLRNRRATGKGLPHFPWFAGAAHPYTDAAAPESQSSTDPTLLSQSYVSCEDGSGPLSENGAPVAAESPAVPPLGSPFVERRDTPGHTSSANPVHAAPPRAASPPARPQADRASPPNVHISHPLAPIYLPTPIGGFPVVHRSDPRSLTRNLDAKQLADWMDHPRSTSIAVQVYGLEYPTLETQKATTDGIRDALVAITRCRTIEVASPIAAKDDLGEPLLPLPSTYFAYNMWADVAARLKGQVCWSTTAISFFAYDLDPTIPAHLFTLRGFTRRDPKVIEDIVRRTMFSPAYTLFTASFASGTPLFHGLSPEAISEILGQSLKVTVAESTPSRTLNVNVYCKAPTTTPELWTLWRDTLGAAEYGHSFVGVGSRVEDACTGCHGADHGVSDCPFGRLLGWNAEHMLRE